MQVDISSNTTTDMFALGHATQTQLAVTGLASNVESTARSINDASDTDWRDLLRDMTAIANSGGGKITLDHFVDESAVCRQLALARLFRLSIRVSNHADGSTGVISIDPAKLPIEFEGIVYFRHGDRSEPASAADVTSALRRLLARVRRRWLRGIRRVIDSPLPMLDDEAVRRGAERSASHDYANLQPVRIVNDPNVPALHPQDVDRLYPWRQKDLIIELNRRLGRRVLNSYDIQAVRRQHRLDEHPEYVFNLPGAGRRYSPVVADWMMDEYTRDPEFFHRARTADHELMKLRRQRPK